MVIVYVFYNTNFIKLPLFYGLLCRKLRQMQSFPTLRRYCRLLARSSQSLLDPLSRENFSLGNLFLPWGPLMAIRRGPVRKKGMTEAVAPEWLALMCDIYSNIPYTRVTADRYIYVY